MSCTKSLGNAVVSEKCFRLLYLKHEIQTDVKVLKAVVDEVDVLRLCHSFGMTLSQSSTASMHEFELGMFDPEDYDADFARFMRESVLAGYCRKNQKTAQDDNDLKICCLFGKQLEVKAELGRMGFWDGECEEGLSFQDQGVFCMKSDVDCRQLVAFAWLGSNLFESETIRDTPAYVLRFLLTLSPNITCCLSERDFQRMKSEVDALSEISTGRRNSYSVAFRVQKQVEQTDSVTRGPVSKRMIPKIKCAKSVWLAGGVVPAIAVEGSTPLTTEWVEQNAVVSRDSFAQWMWEKHQNHAIKLPFGRIQAVNALDDLLMKFHRFPEKELRAVRSKYNGKVEEGKGQVTSQTLENVSEIYRNVVESAKFLFAVKGYTNTAAIDSAQTDFGSFLEQHENSGVLNRLGSQALQTLLLPQRIQHHMKILSDAYQSGQSVFEVVLEMVVSDNPITADVIYTKWYRSLMFWKGYSAEFQLAMEQQQPRLTHMWSEAIELLMQVLYHDIVEEKMYDIKKRYEYLSNEEEENVKRNAFGRLRQYLETENGRLKIRIKRIVCTANGDVVRITWSEEVKKEPTKIISMYQLVIDGTAQISPMGALEVEPGFEVCKLAAVKYGLIIAILVNEHKTIVRRYLLQPDLKAEVLPVRTFPHACSLCSIRANDRRAAFLFGVSADRLGKVAFCRFNEAFTRVEVTLNIDINASFGLAGPLTDILLTEKSLCLVDESGDIQSFDVRTQRTSKKASFGKKDIQDDGIKVGGLLSFADELVIGQVKIHEKKKQLYMRFISNEDHRPLPSAIFDMPSTKLAIGSMDDVLYVVNTCDGSIYSPKLSVTVRSDSFRVQRSGNGAKCSLRAHEDGKRTASEPWLGVFYHVFEKFPVQSLVDMSMSWNTPFSLALEITVNNDSNGGNFCASDALGVCVKYLNTVMINLRRLNKPLSGLSLVKNLTYRNSGQTKRPCDLQGTSVERFLLAVVSFVPVQICRAEDNMLKLLQNGQNVPNRAKGSTSTSSGGRGADALEIAQTIRFGLLSPLLSAWNGRCVVVTSMGKQSTGKSYFLNHLVGTSFAISGSRCTDGAWMSLRYVSSDVLLVVLDFEGLGSFERSEQEDVFLSVLNASVSLFTVFRMESRFDKDIDSLFSRFQKGVQLIKNDARLFRGLLYMSVKDVNTNDRQGVIDELVGKLDVIFEANRNQNFLTDMYDGQLEINCSPPFGTVDYYQCMENDAAKTLCNILSPSDGVQAGFVTGKAFLDCLRIVLAKISILDWTSMDKCTQNLIVADIEQKLPGILRTGCHVPLALVKDKYIPAHLKEGVLQVGCLEKLVVPLEVMCEAYSGCKAKWLALNKVILLDSVQDEDIDLEFDVTCSLRSTKLQMVQKAISSLFKLFLNLRGKPYGSCRIATTDQSEFDDFVAFVIRRRAKKMSLWLHDSLGSQLSEVRTRLEQRYVDPLIVFMCRCRQKCMHCHLGCMNSVTHLMETAHDCCTEHKCPGRCEYGECQRGFDAGQVPPCSRSAGHEGKCECEKGEHTCGQPCVLNRSSNCNHTCSKRAEHPGEHFCSVQVHVCGRKCSATNCSATCLLDIQREHSVHKCAETQCLEPCLMDGCKNTCGENNHFHGQHAVSHAFERESGLGRVTDASNDYEVDGVVRHMCSHSHACGEMCSVDGICEQKVHLKKSARTYTGARGSFEYIYQEMNGCKRHCAYLIPSGEVEHEGSHTCVVRTCGEGEDTEQNSVHYCDARCPSCNYYCNKHFGHMELHATSHGNMHQTYFIAKGNEVDVEDRKYKVGEQGIAEMCNLFCAKMGRGHVHYLPCESHDDEKCVYYTSDASKDHRRHCMDELFPRPSQDMDELLHAQFWTAIGWEDPCSDEERAAFSKCPFECNAPEHDRADGEASYCALDAWHMPELKPDEADSSFGYVDGHKFKCVHFVDTDKFHIVFVLDSSGSMSGRPWKNLLCACHDFGLSRLSDGGENDLITYITFDRKSHIVCEGEPLPKAWNTFLPFLGRGTSFSRGLRAASEVLSRNNFEEYKSVLIFFSDGHPRDVDLGISLATHIRSRYGKYDLKAFVVGFFGRVNVSVLERIASELGGKYRQVLETSELRTEFQRIAAVLSKTSAASLALLNGSKVSLTRVNVSVLERIASE